MFSCRHVRHINLMKIHPQRITQEYKKLANYLHCDRVEVPVRRVLL